MAATGARGKTQRQLGRAPDTIVLKDASYRLLMANRLWVQNGISLQDNYLEGIDKAFGVRPWIVDFKKAPDFVRDRMNGWVFEKTSGKIQDFIHEDWIDSSMRMVLGSAISFKASWMAPFDRALTKEETFTAPGHEKTKVPFVHRTGFFQYAKEPDFQVVELPFLDGELSFVILLPSHASHLANLDQSLKVETLERWLNELSLKEVSLSIPKFDVTTSIDISDQLKLLGVTDAFQDEVADFSGMTGTRDLTLSRVFHKTQFLFSEEGTEAGSVAGPIASRGLASDSNPIPFKVDRPFLFLVRHRASSVILFLGKVLKVK
jgi:serpin B